MNEDRRYSTAEVERIIHATERLSFILEFMLLSDGELGQAYLNAVAKRPDLPTTTDTDSVSGAPDLECSSTRAER
jgi:hypothetical protein